MQHIREMRTVMKMIKNHFLLRIVQTEIYRKYQRMSSCRKDWPKCQIFRSLSFEKRVRATTLLQLSLLNLGEILQLNLFNKFQ